jgi:tetratricopeptide (TPR) repeat protein
MRHQVPVNSEQEYSALLTTDFGVLNSEQGIEQLGLLVDLSFELGKVYGVERAIGIGEELHKRNLTPVQKTILHYFQANGWANLRYLRNRGTTQNTLWEYPEIESELFFLRSAIRSPAFPELSDVRRCQIHTNLGNLLNHIGRFVEAIEQWEQALAINPSFGMAIGNRGVALTYYARNLYDSGRRRRV